MNFYVRYEIIYTIHGNLFVVFQASRSPLEISFEYLWQAVYKIKKKTLNLIHFVQTLVEQATLMKFNIDILKFGVAALINWKNAQKRNKKMTIARSRIVCGFVIIIRNRIGPVAIL